MLINNALAKNRLQSVYKAVDAVYRREAHYAVWPYLIHRRKKAADTAKAAVMRISSDHDKSKLSKKTAALQMKCGW